jgi:hypothetical protein
MDVTKVIIIVALLTIVYQLGYAAYCLIQTSKKRSDMVRALTWRIGLSLGLFVLLMVGFLMGWLHPHGVVG